MIGPWQYDIIFDAESKQGWHFNFTKLVLRLRTICPYFPCRHHLLGGGHRNQFLVFYIPHQIYLKNFTAVVFEQIEEKIMHGINDDVLRGIPVREIQQYRPLYTSSLENACS